jgi:prepilin-type N-terminal cleavage/methylation domain-containing protein/prepilin-type processing-associated H-X9-DG protein
MAIAYPRSRGFTLVELLVVIAIIGVLVALLLPAVQAARESARRMQCASNLKQMGLACHNYNDTFGKLPSALMGGKTSNVDSGYGWGVALLPFIEQKGLYDQLNATVPIGTERALQDYFSKNQAPIPGGETKLKAYACPSSQMPALVPALFRIWGAESSAPPSNLAFVGYAKNDYKTGGGSCYGDDGVMHKLNEAPENRRLSEITDGLSNTILIGESSYVGGNSSTAPTSTGDWPIWTGSPGTDESVRMNGRTNSPINCGCTVVTMVKKINDDCAFSFHPNGAQFVFCDGSVHFISQNIAMTTYCNLHSMRDGQPLGQW